jgi:HAD superfamily hydrolase (TIGR01509 family)
MMDLSALRKYIDLIVSNEDVARGKPDPEMYLQAMDFFGLDAKECLIVEDNPNGIKAAIDSGGHLLRINEITDVNIENIMSAIDVANSRD